MIAHAICLAVYIDKANTDKHHDRAEYDAGIIRKHQFPLLLSTAIYVVAFIWLMGVIGNPHMIADGITIISSNQELGRYVVGAPGVVGKTNQWTNFTASVGVNYHDLAVDMDAVSPTLAMIIDQISVVSGIHPVVHGYGASHNKKAKPQ